MSNLFKYTKRVLTSVLAAAVVLTAIPSTAFGAEPLDEDLVEAVEVQEAEVADEAAVEEEAAATDGTGNDEAEIIGEEEAPDKASNDIKVTFTDSTRLAFFSKSGDTYTAITADQYATSDMDYTVYIQADDGYKFPTGDNAKLILTYGDYSKVESHTEGTADSDDANYVAVNGAVAQASDTYSVGSLFTAADGNKYYPVTFKADFFKKLLYIKGGTKRAQNASNEEIYKATLAVKAPVAADDTITVEVVKGQGGKYNLNTATMDESLFEATKDNLYALQLSGLAGLIRGGDKSTIAAGGVSATDLVLEEVKSDGTVARTIPVVNAGNTAETLLKGMTVTINSDPAINGTALAAVSDNTLWKDEVTEIYTGEPTLLNDEKTLFVHADVINEVYANKDLTLRLTVGKAEATVKKHSFTGRNTSLIKITAGTGITDGKFVDANESSAVDVQFNVAVDETAKGQSWMTPGGYRTIDEIVWTVSGSDPVKVAGVAVSQDVTVAKEKLTADMTVTATTKETVCAEAGEFIIYDDEGTQISTGVQDEIDTVKTGDSYSFTVVPTLGYAIADSKGVTYRIGNSTTDLEPTKTTKNGVTVYTVANVTDTLDITVTTVADSNKKSATITSGTSATVETLAGSGITTSSADNIQKGQILYFTVAPAAGTAITSITYTMEDATGTAGASKAALAAGKTSGDVAIYRTQEAVTGDVVIDVKATSVINVYGAVNDKVDIYAVVDGKDVKLGATATELRTDNDIYFRVEPKSDKTKVTDLGTGDDIDIRYHIEATATRGAEDVDTGTETPISAKGNGSIGAVGSSGANKHLYFIVATTTEKEYGKDFVAYFAKTGSGAINVTDSVNTAKDTLLGQSLALAQSESDELAVTFYEGTKVVMNKAETPVVDPSMAAKVITPDAAIAWSVEKDTATKGQIAEFDSNTVYTYDSYKWNNDGEYIKYATGTDNIVATATVANATTFNTDSYSAKLPLSVAAEYSDYQVKATLGSSDPASETAITSMNRKGAPVYFTVEGKSGRTGEWEDIKYDLASSATDVDSVAWTATPDQTGLITPLYSLDDATLSTSNQASIDFSSVTSTSLSDITVKATVTMRDGKTKVEKNTKVNVVDATNGYYILPVATITGGDEFFGPVAIANLDSSNHGHGLALQKSGAMSGATIAYRVFELTDAGKAKITDSTYSGIYDMGDTLLISEAGVKAAVEEDKYFVDVTKNATFSAMTVENGCGTGSTKEYTDYWNAYGSGDAHYSKKYIETPTLSGNTYTVTAKEMTGVDSGATVFVKCEMTASVNGVLAGTDFVYFTVANEFPTTDLTLILKDADNKDSDGKVIVQKLTGYLPQYTNVQHLDAGNLEDGRVIKDVVVGSKINLPTEAMLATTTGSSRKLLGFTDSSANYYAPGEEIVVEAGKTYTAVWDPKYKFENLYNKNNAVTESGKTTYGDIWAGYDEVNGVAVNPTMSATGKVPVIASIRTTHGFMLKADAEKYAAMGADNPYPGKSAGDEYWDSEYVETGVKVDYATTATDDQKTAATITGDRTITAVKAPKTIPLVATYTVGSDVYKMQSTAGTFDGALSLTTAPVATYVITAPDPKPVYYVGQDESATGLNVTVTKSGEDHDLIAKNVTVTSSNTSVVKVEVGTVVAASKVVPLKFTPVKAGTANITMSIKDSEGIETEEATTFEVEIKDEGITFEFYSSDGKTKITKLDAKANNSGSDKYIVRAKQNGTVLQNMTNWGVGATVDSTVVSGLGALVNEDDGFGKVVPVYTNDVLQSDGWVVITATSAAGVKYGAKLDVRTYRTATFGDVSSTAKEILVNGTPYKTGDPAVVANYPVKVFADDVNANKKYTISLNGIAATSKVDAMDFIGWTDSEGVLEEATKTGSVELEMGADAILTANFEATAVTLEGITDGETVVVTPESKTTNHKQFSVGVTPYTSATQLTVVPEKGGFYKIVDGKLSGDYDPTGAATATAVDITKGSTAQGRRVDEFYVGTFENTSGWTVVEIQEKAAPHRTLKTFNLVATGANFVGGTAVGNITKYVDYNASKGAYEVKLDKRTVNSTIGDVYFDEEGKPVENGVATLTNGDGKSYLIKDYKLAYGTKGGSFVTVDGKKYFADENGIVSVATLVIDPSNNKQYYVNSEGVLITAKDAVNGKYTDPVTQMTYVIADDDTAAPDKLRVDASIEWSLTTGSWPKSYKSGDPIPKAKYTIKYKLEGDKDYQEPFVSGEITATMDPATIGLGTKTVTFKFQATEAQLAGYYSDSTGKKQLTDAGISKTYHVNSGGTFVSGGIEITGFEEGQEFKFTGSAIKPPVEVWDNDLGEKLVLGVDYTLSYKNNTKITTDSSKTPIVTVNGKGNYAGKNVTRTFKIVNPIEGETDLTATVKKVDLGFTTTPVYNGEEWYPDTITVDGNVFQHSSGDSYTTEGTANYVFTFSGNVDAGTATVGVTGQDGKTKKKTFKINKVDLSKVPTANLEISPADAEWAVKGTVPATTVTYTPEGGSAITLVEGQDYTLKVNYADKKKNVADGNTVTITGKGTNFSKKATSTETFAITAYEIGDKNILSVVAAAGMKKKAVKATVVDGKDVVINAKNYTINVYDSDSKLLGDNDVLKAGEEYKVEVVAPTTGNITGSGEFEFVAAADMSKAKVTLSKDLKKNGVAYTGEAIDITNIQSGELIKNLFTTGDITVEYKNPSTKKYEKLTWDEDFEVVGYQNNVKKGTMTVYIRAKDDSTKVSGVKNFKIKISAKTMQKAQ